MDVVAPAEQPIAEMQAMVLGRRLYEPVWRAMQAFTDQRDGDTSDAFWVVEHDPVFTLGQAGKMTHVLAPGDIPVVRCDRGGQVTYHGPGQVVVYPLLDLERLGVGVRCFVDHLEQAAIDTCAGLHITAERKSGAPGVYVNGAKLFSIGLRVRKGCTFHGIAFNQDMDLSPFGRINPCGYQGQRMTDLKRLGVDMDFKTLAFTWLDCLANLLHCQIRQVDLPEFVTQRL